MDQIVDKLILKILMFAYLFFSSYFAIGIIHLVLCTEAHIYVKIAGSILIMAVYVIILLLLLEGNARQRYRVYEREYKDIIHGAFYEDKKSYKRLMKSIGYYCAGEYKKAHKCLNKLSDKCRNTRDYVAVYMFLALCYWKMEQNEQAVAAYEQVLRYEPTNSRAWSNMGVRLTVMGRTEEAQEARRNAIRYNSMNVDQYSK